MKKLYLQLALALAAIAALLCFCACFSAYTKNAVAQIEDLLAATPAPEDFEAAAADEEAFGELLARVASIKAETKKAGDTLAFFIHYEYLNALNASAETFEASVRGKEPAAYGAARAALAEALESVRRAEDFSLERLL